MSQRLQYFNELCAILLAVTCAIAFITSRIEAREGQYPTWKVVCCELPILLYIFLLAGFLLPTRLKGLQILLVAGSCAALLVSFLIRCFNYSTRHEARERAELLASHAEVIQKIEEAKVRVMTLVEKEAFLKANQPKRVSRYERPPVI